MGGPVPPVRTQAIEKREAFDQRSYSHKIRDMLERHLDATGLSVMVKLRHITDPEFWEDFKVEGKTEDDLKTAAIRKTTELRKVVYERLGQNAHQYGKFSDRLRELLEKLEGAQLSWTDTLKMAEDLAKDVEAQATADEDAGMSQGAYSILQILLAFDAGEGADGLTERIAALYADDATAPRLWKEKEGLRRSLRQQVRGLAHEFGLGNLKEVSEQVEEFALKHSSPRSDPMPMLTVGSVEIAYVLRRSDAATRARIVVTPDSVEVVVPTAATEDEIAGVLHRRRVWLYEQTRHMAERMGRSTAVRRFVSGAKVPYRGRLMRLRVDTCDDTLVTVAYSNGFLVGCPRSMAPASYDDLIESALRLWLRRRLRQDVADLVLRHGEPNGLKPRDVRLKDQKHVWASCGINRIVSLNWQLVFARRTVLEYAVVHELCHLRHRPDDRAFWGLVGTILPDWEARKAWLDQKEHFLTLLRLEST